MVQKLDGDMIEDGLLDAKLDKAGGTMTGDLVLAGDPDADLKAAPKQYVDAHYPAPRTLALTSGATADLADVEAVTFNYASPTSITTFANVVPGKLYSFRNIGVNAITVTRNNAYLDGGTDKVLNTHDVLLLVGSTSTSLWQAAQMPDNS